MPQSPQLGVVPGAGGGESAGMASPHRVHAETPPIWLRLLAWLGPLALTLAVVALAARRDLPTPLATIALDAPAQSAGRDTRVAPTVFERAGGGPLALYGRFHLDSLPAGDLLLHARRYNGAFALTLNGHALMAPYLPWRRARDSLVVLPRPYLREGDNLLVWALEAGPAMVYLPSVVERGDLRVVQQDEGSMFLAVAASASLTLGLLLSGIWLTRRHALEFLLFALGMFAWNGYLVATQGPLQLSPTASHVAAHWLLQAFVLFIALFARRFAGRPWSAPDGWLVALALAAAGGLLLAYLMADVRTLYGSVAQAHRAILLGYGLVILLTLVPAARREAEVTRDLMAGTALSGLLLGIHDALSFLSAAPRSLIGYGLPVALAAMGVVIVLRYARALRETEQLNRELDARVQEKAQALESLYAQHAELQRQQALDAERERILRDMHDGVGGHLVALLAASQRSDLAPAELRAGAAAALRDLRWMIDSLDLEIGDLAVALASFATRARPMLETAGVHLDLEIEALPDGVRMSPERLLQLFRLCDEALQNVLKHAGATCVTLRAGLQEAQRLQLRLSDNGRGFDVARERTGRGLEHMRQRAARLGGRLALHSDTRGTVVEIDLPVLAAASSDAAADHPNLG